MTKNHCTDYEAEDAKSTESTELACYKLTYYYYYYHYYYYYSSNTLADR